MIFSNDEKLTLFLIWWHCEELISLDTLSKEFNDNVLACGIERDSDFIQFLSDAYEFEEEFEFWVSDWTISEIKKGNCEATSTCLWKNEWKKCANKIKITVG